MAKIIKLTALISVLLMIGSLVAYIAVKAPIFFTLAITFGTIAYHFVMRLVVGFIFDKAMNNKADYTKRWYQVSAGEQKLYQRLHVKKWKKYMPTYEAELFDNSRHSWEEIAQAMCQSELVHETIVVLSFVPVIFSIWFGAFPVFLITSIAGALFDMMFVIMQRYNRPRIVRLIRGSRGDRVLDSSGENVGGKK